ncbi:MAG: NDP-sugar synthase [Endomicrobiales bacterium]|nr:NDP-sugar synthase [Endomicrobiales bacterium]
MKALILIGGFGTRLRPLTCSMPKPMLPIINRPFLEYQFRLLKKYGIRDVVLCVAYMPNDFRRHFGSGKKLGLNITYVHEKEPLGTGGAVKNAAKYINGPTFVLNGDILSDVNLKGMYDFHKSKKGLATIALARVKDPTMFGLVETDKKSKIERFIEKPSWDEVTCNTINAGFYIIEPNVLSFMPSGINYSIERGLFPTLLKEQLDIYGYVFRGYWLDIGTIDKYLQAHYDLINSGADFDMPGKMRQDNLWVGNKLKWGKNVDLNGRMVCGNNVNVGDFSQFIGNVCLGSNVRIGQGSVVSNSVILDNTVIGEGVRIEKSVIGKNCTIESSSSISANSAVGNKTVISRHSRF